MDILSDDASCDFFHFDSKLHNVIANYVLEPTRSHLIDIKTRPEPDFTQLITECEVLDLNPARSM
jgi:hypothetical protein